MQAAVLEAAAVQWLMRGVLTVYLLADLPRIRRLIYPLIPASRRPRAILLGDEMFTRVGGFVLGNLLISLIAGVGTFVAAGLVGLSDVVPRAGCWFWSRRSPPGPR